MKICDGKWSHPDLHRRASWGRGPGSLHILGLLARWLQNCSFSNHCKIGKCAVFNFLCHSTILEFWFVNRISYGLWSSTIIIYRFPILDCDHPWFLIMIDGIIVYNHQPTEPQITLSKPGHCQVLSGTLAEARVHGHRPALVAWALSVGDWSFKTWELSKREFK